MQLLGCIVRCGPTQFLSSEWTGPLVGRRSAIKYNTSDICVHKRRRNHLRIIRNCKEWSRNDTSILIHIMSCHVIQNNNHNHVWHVATYIYTSAHCTTIIFEDWQNLLYRQRNRSVRTSSASYEWWLNEHRISMRVPHTQKNTHEIYIRVCSWTTTICVCILGKFVNPHAHMRASFVRARST